MISFRGNSIGYGGHLFKAMALIAELAAKADVHGTPRVSITFYSPLDAACFQAEAKREIEAGGLSLTFNGHLDLHNCKIHGVAVRIL